MQTDVQDTNLDNLNSIVTMDSPPPPPNWNRFAHFSIFYGTKACLLIINTVVCLFIATWVVAET